MNYRNDITLLFVLLLAIAWCTPAAAQYESNALSAAVDETRYEFIGLGDRPFFSQSRTFTRGGTAAQSGNIGDNQVSVLYTIMPGGETIAFDWKVSSESGYDGLIFFFTDINGNLVGQDDVITGDIDWHRKEFTAPGSANVFAIWAYSKDVSLSSGADAGWVDNVQIGRAPGRPGIAALPAITMLLLGDNDTEDPDPPAEGLNPPIPETYEGTYQIALVSDTGDSIGRGQRYTYIQTNSNIQITSNSVNHLAIRIDGWGLTSGTQRIPDLWNWNMESASSDPLAPGVYTNTTRYPYNSGNGLDFNGNSSNCITSSGQFRIFEIEYSSGNLTKLVADFEQTCDGNAGVLRGSIRYDDSKTPLALSPPQPPSGTPDPPLPPLIGAGAVVEIVSETGDYVGGGTNYSFNNSNASFSAWGYTTNRAVTIRISSDARWELTLARGSLDIDPNRDSPLAPGTYLGVFSYPFHEPAPGLSYFGNGRRCATLTGSFRIFEISFDAAGDLQSLTAAFIQNCGGTSSGVLRGSIQYSAPL